MNDFELHAKLKNVPVPDRPEEYWNDFPARISRELRRPAAVPAPVESWRPRLAWQFAAWATCLIAGLLLLNQPLRAASTVVAQKEIALRHQLNALPKHLSILMADEHGLHYLIADKD